MYTGESLFSANDEGNLDEDQLRLLFAWTNDFKSKRLQKVKNSHARNLVSRLLMKDPSKRPDASHALAHPFFSGKKVARMIGEKAEYDVFLSYREKCDFHTCKLIYDLLIKKGLRVWWDKKCLLGGEDWEEGFCEGLIKSRAFVPLLSRAGLHTFEGLAETSQCDNVLLEYRLALELQSFNLLEFVFPVLVGDSSGKSTDPRYRTYTNYFKSGCLPNCPDIIVKSVEEKLSEHLNNQGLGAPVISNRTVRDICVSLTNHQGGLIEGNGREGFSAIVESIYKMIKLARDPTYETVWDHGQRELETLRSKNSELDKEVVKLRSIKSEWDCCQRELESLRSKNSEWDCCQRELESLRSIKSELDCCQRELESLRSKNPEWDCCQRELESLRSKNPEWDCCQRELETLRSRNSELDKEVVKLRSIISEWDCCQRAKKSEWDCCQRELESLRSKNSELEKLVRNQRCMTSRWDYDNNRELDQSCAGVTKIHASASYGVGVIDPLGQNRNFEVCQVRSESYYLVFTPITISLFFRMLLGMTFIPLEAMS